MTDHELLLQISEQITGVSHKVDGLETKVDGLKTKVDSLETKFDNLETRFDGLEKRTQNIEFLIENTLLKEIRLIADGHVDLMRNLKESQISSQQFTHMEVRMDHLEYEMKDLKTKLQIAE